LGSREFTHTSMRPTRKQATLAAGPRRITREFCEIAGAVRAKGAVHRLI
jgi:hypothetical protein